MKPTAHVAFLGAGGFAQSHAYALDALKYYYSNTPEIRRIVVASPTPSSREAFARRFGFQAAIPPDEIWDRTDIDTLFILGPNHTHTPHLLKAVKMPSIKRIYVEKPLAISEQEILDLKNLEQSDHGKEIMVGYEFLQKAALRKALSHWQEGLFGEPIHFRIEYLHSSYLDPTYRQKHVERLQPIPSNGAVVDLGSHALSMLLAFFGDQLVVRSALTSGHFEDSPENTDFCTTVMMEEASTGAVGTMVASRVSQGAGDHFLFDLRATHGALIYTTSQPDEYKTYLQGTGWQVHKVMSDYLPGSTFPSDYMPAGWLRALVHNHYLFLGGEPGFGFIPGLQHGIQVQQLIQQIAIALDTSIYPSFIL